MNVEHEVELLITHIKRLGTTDPSGQYVVKFGVLFNDDVCANLFEALVGTLKAAKKKKIITYDGELLLQGVHDNAADCTKMEDVNKDSCVHLPSYTVLYSRNGSHSAEDTGDSDRDSHSSLSATLAEECQQAEYNKNFEHTSQTLIKDKSDNSDITNNSTDPDKQSGCLNEVESTKKSFDKSTLVISAGLNMDNNIDLNFMPVHSNQYVESQRNKFLKTFSFLTDKKTAGISDHVHYTRPRFPYMPWNESVLQPSMKKEVLLSRFDKTFNPHASESMCENILQTLATDRTVSAHSNVSTKDCSKFLTDFTHCLINQSSVRRSAEAERIRSDIETIVISFLEKMHSRYKIFHDYKLLKMGSTYEGTKIGKPDEFDFMVELPYLCEVLGFVEDKVPFSTKSRFSSAEMRTVSVLNRLAFSDIYVPETGDESDEQFISNVWHVLQTQMEKDLKSHLLEGWEWLNTILGFNTLALTQTFLWNGNEFHKLVVDVDICLAIPLSKHNFRTCIDFNQEMLDYTRPGIGGKFTETTDNTFTHVLLRSDGKARLTLAVREMMIWNHFANDNKKSLFRCMKKVVAKYLPGKYSEELYRLDAMIPSYWLKTVLFYMFTNYVEEENWSDAQLPLRFLEAMLLLEKCLKCKQLSSFFVPHNVIKRYSHDSEEITRCLNVLVELLLLLQIGDNAGLSRLQKLEKDVRSINEEMLEKSLYSSLIDTCYIYAYNDYEHLTGLKSFVSVFLSDCVTIKGERNNMKVWYKGAVIDVDAEIYRKYQEGIRYFWTDVQLSHVQSMVQRLRLRCPALSIGRVPSEIEYSSTAFAKPL